MIDSNCNRKLSCKEPKSYRDIYVDFIKDKGLNGLEFFVGDYEENKTVLVETSEILNI